MTGASGTVGAAIANAARGAGYRVRVLVRPSSPRTNIEPTDEVFIGDICDRASLVPALRGVRYLAHAAADYRLWSPTREDIVRTSVEGTRTIMDEALRAGVERIVYTSSVATLELRDDMPADETARSRKARRSAPTRRARSSPTCGRGHGAAPPAVIVNPAAPIGPAT